MEQIQTPRAQPAATPGAMSAESEAQRQERLNRDARVETARGNAKEKARTQPKTGYAKPRRGDEQPAEGKEATAEEEKPKQGKQKEQDGKKS